MVLNPIKCITPYPSGDLTVREGTEHAWFNQRRNRVLVGSEKLGRSGRQGGGARCEWQDRPQDGAANRWCRRLMITGFKSFTFDYEHLHTSAPEGNISCCPLPPSASPPIDAALMMRLPRLPQPQLRGDRPKRLSTNAKKTAQLTIRQAVVAALRPNRCVYAQLESTVRKCISTTWK